MYISKVKPSSQEATSPTNGSDVSSTDSCKWASAVCGRHVPLSRMLFGFLHFFIYCLLRVSRWISALKQQFGEGGTCFGVEGCGLRQELGGPSTRQRETPQSTLWFGRQTRPTAAAQAPAFQGLACIYHACCTYSVASGTVHILLFLKRLRRVRTWGFNKGDPLRRFAD